MTADGILSEGIRSECGVCGVIGPFREVGPSAFTTTAARALATHDLVAHVSTEHPDRYKGVRIYATGLLYCSVCAPSELSAEDVVEVVNRMSPTGIQSSWRKDPDGFRGGESNPCSCPDEPDRLHYLMSC